MTLDRALFSVPPMDVAEAIRKVGDLYNRTKLTPRVKRLLNWLMSVQR